MATVAFALAGSALGSAIGGSVLGISAAVLGRAVGGFIGQQVDAALRGGLPPVTREGPRLDSLDVMTSRAGDPLADVSGRAAVLGTVIWAAKLKEVSDTDRKRVGSGKRKQKVKTVTYSYLANFAVAVCEGPIRGFGRVWAEGRLLDIPALKAAGVVVEYRGTESQSPNSTIAAIEGYAPAFRGVAYLVFRDFDVTDYGGRIPQIKAEVFGQSGDMETLVRGVNLIPGTTESGYLPKPASRLTYGTSNPNDLIAAEPQNANRHKGTADWNLSLDLMDTVLPNADTVSLVVAWFGNDLRAGRCTIQPRVELRTHIMDTPWTAAGFDRWDAPLVSQVNGRPAYGSSPSDASIVEAIRNLKARGKRVVLYPFIMMDIQGSQNLPHPSGSGTQPDFPWRGRIIPEAGQSVASEISSFVNGPWGLRNFITHLAGLASQAGGVDTILIGSELRGLTMAHAGGGSFPMAGALASIASDVKSILPSAKVSYAADWSEYHSYREGSDVYFHLDALWADNDVDFVGIDNYLPLSDWRDGPDHLDRNDAAGVTSIYDLDYLKSNIEGGEYWDWYYASQSDRDAQIRTPIADAAHGEHWVFRQKAIRDWQQNAHHHRPGGVRNPTRTGWVPGSKPVWFTELGCPAIDKGPNQPNVFVSRLSSESTQPHYSGGVRDDFVQRQFLVAWLEWLDAHGGSIINRNDVQIWAWDARPWPEFPLRTSIWADGPDWLLGHWLNGRAGAAPARETIQRRAQRHGLSLSDLDLSKAFGQADGYAAPGPLGLREFLQPLEVGLGLQGHEADGRLVFEERASVPTLTVLDETRMIEAGPGTFSLTRPALEDVPDAALFVFRDGSGDYDTAVARAGLNTGPETGVSRVEVPLCLDFERGHAAAERIVRGAQAARDEIAFSVPRSMTDIRPGAVLPVQIGGQVRLFSVDMVTDGTAREVKGRLFPANAYAPTGGVVGLARAGRVLGSSVVLPVFLDLPLIAGSDANEWDGWLAAHSSPFPGVVAMERSTEAASGFGNALPLDVGAVVGETMADFAPDAPDVFTAGPLEVRLYSGSLVSIPEDDVLGGENWLAVIHPGGVELVGFANAELIGAREYRLTGLLRGLNGTETIPENAPLPAGARVVFLDGSVVEAGLGVDEIRAPRFWRYGPGADDPAGWAVTSHTFQGAGLRPFAPADLAADTSGPDLVLTWTRRTRLPVETFADTPVDLPLGEASEAYRVQIGPAAAPVREFDVTAPAAAYSAAQMAADGIAAPFRVAVAQLSETYGPGSWAEVTVE